MNPRHDEILSVLCYRTGDGRSVAALLHATPSTEWPGCLDLVAVRWYGVPNDEVLHTVTLSPETVAALRDTLNAWLGAPRLPDPAEAAR